MILWTELSYGRKSKVTLLQVEVIAAKILQSSSRSGWPLQNIHISHDNESFTFYVIFVFPPSLLRPLPDLSVYIEQYDGCLIKTRTYLPFRSTWVHPRYMIGSALLIFYLSVFVLYVLVLCLGINVFCFVDVSLRSEFRVVVFGSSLPSVVCRRAHVVFILFLYLSYMRNVAHVF